MPLRAVFRMMLLLTFTRYRRGVLDIAGDAEEVLVAGARRTHQADGVAGGS